MGPSQPVKMGSAFHGGGKTKGTAGSGVWVRGSAWRGSSSPELPFLAEHQFRPSSPPPPSPVTCRVEGALIQSTPRVASECELVCRGHERAPAPSETCLCVARSLSITCVNAWRSPGPWAWRALGRAHIRPWARMVSARASVCGDVLVRPSVVPLSGCDSGAIGAAWRCPAVPVRCVCVRRGGRVGRDGGRGGLCGPPCTRDVVN